MAQGMSGTASSTLHMRPHAYPVRSKLLLASIPQVREGRHGVTQHMRSGSRWIYTQAAWPQK